MTGAQNSSLDLLTVLRFTVIVLFDDDHRDCLYLLICREPAFAGVADSASADGIILLNRSGIRNSGILTSTIRASHTFPPF